MKKNVFIILWSLFFSSVAQGGVDWISDEQQSVLKAMMLDYSLPEGFTGIKYDECFDSISQNDWILPCVTSHIVSQEKHFHVSLVIFDTFSRSNTDHTGEIWRNIFYSYNGKVFGDSIENYVCPDNAAKISSNADTVIICPLILQEGNRYLNIYNHCEVIYLQKRNRGFIGLYCFYDDIAAAGLDEYMQKVKGIFHYRDCEIKNSDILAPENVTVIGHTTRKKSKMVGIK
ncbi:MAG: hypothetical protein LBH32_00390 [Dysgonamonadaceae bacterium]|jgi:hypothetical protein|nr:hypothetical protein [Dysgonamonadaceae bacterium]